MPYRGYRIGLVTDGTEVPTWVADLSLWASADPAITLAALIVMRPTRPRPLLERLLWFETRLLRGIPELRASGERCSIAGCASIEIPLSTGDASGRLELSDTDASVLEGLGLDALVRCGPVPSACDLARFARDGLLCVSVGVAADEGEAGAGLCEVVEGRTDTRFTIDRSLGDGRRETLFAGSVATSLFFASNFAAVHARAFGYLRQVLERLAAAKGRTRAPGALERGTSVPMERVGGRSRRALLRLAAYSFRTARRSAGKAARRLLGKEFNWQVAFSREPWWNCDPAQATLVANPPGAFLADPFAIGHGGRDYLFVEEFPFDSRKGVISAYELVGDEAKRIGPVLEEPYHLSFPFVFRHKGEMLMVPESGADRSVKLYRSSAFPGGWSLAKVLMSDLPAVDSILFEQDGRWWLLATIKGDGPALNNAELHAFHAPDPFGEWTAHSDNPIVMDATKGRNGGFLRGGDGAPYRVAQVPGFTFYGEQAAIFRIEEITPDTYRERLVRTLVPDFLPALDGTHHMSGHERLTVFDFMRVERPGSGRRTRGRWRATTGPISRVPSPGSI